MNKKLILVVAIPFLLAGCFKFPSKSNQSQNSSSVQPTSESSSSGGATTSNQPSEVGVREFDFTSTSITTGANLKNETQLNKLKEFMNKDGEILNSITQESCTFQSLPDTEKTVLTVGTASYAGSISFYFKYKITAIKAFLQGYCKHIVYSDVDTWSMDANAKIDINGHEFALGSTNENPPEVQEQTISFDNATNTITMSNDDAVQRAFVLKLEITYLLND